MRLPASGRAWAINSHFLTPMRLPGGSKYAGGGKRVYAVMVWRQDGQSEAGNPRVRAFVKAFAVDNREQVTAIEDIDDAIWSTIARKIGVTEIGSDSERQYESGLLDKKETQEREARELAERRTQEATDRAKQLEEQKRKVAAAQERTKPACSMVVVNGIVSPGSVYQLEQAHRSSDIEDTVARNPIRCGGAAGCYGVAYLNNRKARIVDWDGNYYLLDVPIDFNTGRRNINAYVRRADAQCADHNSPTP